MPTLPGTTQSGTLKRFLERNINMPPSDSPYSLVARQSNGGGGSGSSCGGICLSSGELAGIIIGTIAGTLLLLWLIYTCSCGIFKTTKANGNNWQDDIEPKRHRHDRHRHSRSRRSGSRQSRRGSSGLSEPQPVIVTDRSRSRPRQSQYVYAETSRGRH
ncbi:hypothetical protein CC79DRAFT_820098 [Sarocladium strictum]